MVKRMWGKRFGAMALAFALLFVTACSGKTAENGGTASPAAAKESPGATNAAAPGGKYDPPIELTTVRSLLEGMPFPSGDNIDNNVWYREYEQKLGIKLKNKWSVNDNQYEQKMNVSIIANDLPDIIPVNAKQLQTLIEGGLIEDLTDVYKKYASPIVKKALESSGGLGLQSATYKGKLMAVPSTSRGLDDAQMLWIRSDWLKKLNLNPPKTLDDLLNIMTAFMEQDPDGNGKKDTYAFNLVKDLYVGYSGIAGFFNMYHAYPYTSSSGSMWIKDASGKLAYGSIQPEMKAPLLQLQKLFKAKGIDPEFVVYDGAKASQNEMQNKTGVHVGTFSNPGWPLEDFKKNNPNGDWLPFPLVSIDDKPALSQVTTPQALTFYAVKKGSKHPEAVFKMLDLYLENIFGTKADPEKYHSKTEGGVSYGFFKYAAVAGGFTENNQNAHYAVMDALKTNDTSKLNPEQKKYYDQVVGFQKGDPALWSGFRYWGPEGSFSVLGQYKNKNAFKINEFIGAPTPTMVEKGSVLMDMEKQMITKIILGEPIELFDQFVKDWKASGGDKITQEVNTWYENRK